MANKQELNNAQAASLTEILQRLTILTEQNRNSNVGSQVFYNTALPNTSNNFSHIGPGEKKIKPKGTRRKPRKKKNKEEVDEGSSLLHSFSSNSSISASPLKNRVSPGCSKKEIAGSSGLSITETFIFSIKPSIINNNSEYIRKRTAAQFIHLKSFINKNSPRYIFISRNNELNHKNIEKLDKAQRRKYPKRETRRERKKKEVEKEDLKFPGYFNEEDVRVGLVNGTLIQGIIRVNPKNYRESYVSNEDSSITDYMVTSVTDRNQALEGDEVVLQVKPKEDWIGETKTAKVVYIKKKIHHRQAVGTLKSVDPNEGNHALFVPRDKRFPIMRISHLHFPNGFKEQPKKFEDILFVGKILDWIVPAYASGIIIEKLGQSGNLKIETKSILKEFNLDITPFSEEIKECIPQLKFIPEKEYEYREDIRKKCVFTIDPATARDLDDAVSVEHLPNGNYEVGVHISDASFFLLEGTELNQVVSKKATTIYLVDNVYHMLPEEMCLGCSLLPGDDKLSFSVFWEMTPHAEVLSTRFSKTIMNSCVKLAYEHAQMVIENPDKAFTASDFPQIHNGFEPNDIVEILKILKSIATILRTNRFKHGALRIDNLKLVFNLNVETGEPLDYSVFRSQESHQLIEEFMLLANISVAQKIHEHFPELAFLRRHEPPKKTMLVNLQKNLAMYGIHLKIASSGDIQTSLKNYFTDDSAGNSRAVALNHLTSKAMTRAQYFCAATVESEKNFKHYALSVPIYTHFTSPIRRYADIMVHRLLAACLNYCDRPEWDTDYVEAIAKNCNMQKYQAKKAQDASMELYLAHYVETNKPFKQDCVVVDVKEKKFDVVILKTGTVVRIYQNNCEKGTQWQYTSNKLTITFPKRSYSEKVSIIIELFTILNVSLKRKDSYHLEGILKRPIQKKNNAQKKN